MMNILVTNDDGIYSPGLLALAKAMKFLGDVTVVAPDKNWSVSGHAKTLRRPLRSKPVKLDSNINAYSIDGTPADCVIISHLGLIKEPIDLVVSGINPFANLGTDLTYSGTVTAAMEAIIWGIPAIAFSINGQDPKMFEQYFSDAGLIAKNVTKSVLDNGNSKEILLNVNIPDLPINKIKGYKVTKQGKRIYQDKLITRQDPNGRPYHWIGGDPPTGIPDEGTDIGALYNDFVSITPIHLDMTSHKDIERLKKYQWHT